MFVQNMPSLAVAMVVAREKNIEKKSIFLRFHETSKWSKTVIRLEMIFLDEFIQDCPN